MPPLPSPTAERLAFAGVDAFGDSSWDPAEPSASDPFEGTAWSGRSALEEITHLEVAQSRFFGGQLIQVAALMADRIAAAEVTAARDVAELRLTGATAQIRRAEEIQHARRSAQAQIGLVLGIAPRAGEGLAALAEAFVDRCPATLTALDAGRISRVKAEIVLDQTVNLNPELRAEVERGALAAAEGRTPESFRDKVRRLVERADADALHRREAAARATRRVELWPESDGMWALHAVLPPEEAFAAFGIVDAWAQSAKKARSPGDERGIDALRADALMDLLRDPTGPDRIAFQVRIVVPLGTVLGLGDEPGFIPGHGPVPAEVCRRIADDATWKRLLAVADTGRLLDVGAHTYQPSARLVDFIRTRDQTCRWPSCRRKAHRSDVDHTVAFSVGGRTVRVNLACLCRFHHGLKHLPGWSCTQDPDGTLTFTTPGGQIHRTRPPTLDGEDHAVETIVDRNEIPPF